MSIGDLVSWRTPLNEKCYTTGIVKAVRYADDTIYVLLVNWTRWILAEECEVVG